MKVGFARVDITPPLGSAMPGYFYTRNAEGVFDPLLLNAVVITVEDASLAIVTADFLSMGEGTATPIRALISRETGIPAENVLLQALHQHTAVNPANVPLHYKELLDRKYVDVVKMALDDQAEATACIGEKETAEPVSFIRRYRMKDGSVMTNPGFLNPDIDHPLGKADNTVRLVRFCREGKADIAMVGFQTHPDTLAGSRFSADWPGFVRRITEKALEAEGVHCILLNGCQGDTNHYNLSRPRPTSVPEERYEVVTRPIGEKIAEAALALWDEVKPVEEGAISGDYSIHPVRTNLNGIERIEECKELQKLLAAKLPTPKKLNLAEMGEVGRISRMENQSLFQRVTVSMVAFGKIAVVGYGGEPFTEYADVLRKAYPELFILTACNCNGSAGYLPSEQAFEEGGYEARSTIFTPVLPGLLQGEAKAKLARHIEKLKF